MYNPYTHVMHKDYTPEGKTPNPGTMKKTRAGNQPIQLINISASIAKTIRLIQKKLNNTIINSPN